MVDDVSCPHCGQSLVEQRTCEECGAPAARLVIYAQSRLVDFSVCTQDRLPLARHVARRPGQDQAQGAAAEEARAGRHAAGAQLQRGLLRSGPRAGRHRGGPLSRLQEAGLRRRLSGRSRYPRVRAAHQGRGSSSRRRVSSSRRTPCRRSAGACARRTTSARSCASSARKRNRWPSATWSASPPTSNGRPMRSPSPARRRRRASGSPWSAAVRPASPWPPTWSPRATR